MEDTFGLDRENDYELYQPDEWEADAAMDDETDWMRRCGALKAYDMESVGALCEKGYDWRWRVSGYLGAPQKTILELLTYYDGQFDGYWNVTLTDEERETFNSDIKDWLKEDGVLDEDGHVINAQRFI